MKITKVHAFQILDSRGYPTIKCTIELDGQWSGSAAVPSGASKGEHEAFELRDGNISNYFGKSVMSAVRNVNTIIAPEIMNQEFVQQELDQKLRELDGTENKNHLGANAILAVSLAFCRASSEANKKPLYKYIREDVMRETENNIYYGVLPMVNVINGGLHANNKLVFQEFMLIPLHPKTMSEAIRTMAECSEAIKNVLLERGEDVAKGDEGGFSPRELQATADICDVLKTGVERAGYKFGEDVSLGFDVAASGIYSDGQYKLDPDAEALSSEGLMAFYDGIIRDFPVVSIEDPFDQNDWKSFTTYTAQVGNDVQIVGDDLYCTNPSLLIKGIQEKATNAILIKVNQIGTLSETLDVIRLAKNNHMNVIIAHRSGDTEDSFIADLAIATNAKQVKFGGMSRSERMAKYNRLLEIEQDETLIMPEWKELKLWE